MNPNHPLIAEYLEAGFKLVPIPEGHKGPSTPGWNKPYGCITNPAQITANVGLAHAYSRTCAVDVDDMDDARAWFTVHGVDIDALLTAPDSVHISSGRPGRAKLLYRLPSGSPLMASKRPTRGLELRCATAGHLTVQDVIPPSIHPVTGTPYVWRYGDDLIGHWSNLPELPASVYAAWTALLARAEAPPQESTGASHGEIKRVLSKLDPDCDYNQWVTVMMAVHHETGGSAEGLELVDEWSASGIGSYAGREAIEYKWSTFSTEREETVTFRWLQAQADKATASDLDIMPTGTAPAVERPRFHVQRAAEFAQRAAPEWLIKGVLPKGELAIIFGASGSGKSFFVFDMIAAMARGKTWREHKTAQARGVYVAAEGAGGVRNRLWAYCNQHVIDPAGLDVGIIGEAPNLMQATDVKDLGAALTAFGKVDWVVIDTVSQVTLGANENSSEDMGKALAHCKWLHKQTGALIILIHHSGKDSSKGARGWSGWLGASDTQIEVTRDDELRIATVRKLKDGEDGAMFGFNLKTVLLGVDSDGDDVTSCIVQPVDVKRALGRPTGPVEQILLAVIEEMRALGPVNADAAIAMCTDRLPIGEDAAGRDNRNKKINSALTKLQAAGFVKMAGGLIEPARQAKND